MILFLTWGGTERIVCGVIGQSSREDLTYMPARRPKALTAAEKKQIRELQMKSAVYYFQTDPFELLLMRLKAIDEDPRYN